MQGRGSLVTERRKNSDIDVQQGWLRIYLMVIDEWEKVVVDVAVAVEEEKDCDAVSCRCKQAISQSIKQSSDYRVGR
jgi:hypothetical protein